VRGRRVTFGLLLLALVVVAPGSASAAPRLDASFAPATLNADAAIKLGFNVGKTPTRLTSAALHLPQEITTGANTLGLATCTESMLDARGPRACPQNSVIGRGRGTVSVPFGAEPILEPVEIEIFMAPAAEEKTRVLFYVEGSDPVIARLVLQGSMGGDAAPFGTLIKAEVPEIASLPGSPPAALVSMQAELGPRDLRYTKREHGKTVSFVPEGFKVPPTCPTGGYPFAATFTFADGHHESASTQAPCPRSRSTRGGRQR
jgi:hypothetical protein